MWGSKSIPVRFHDRDGRVIRTAVMPRFQRFYEVTVVVRCGCGFRGCLKDRVSKRYFEYWDREGRLYVFREIGQEG